MQDHFISCDWGTTHLRVALVEAGSWRVKARARSRQGVAHLHRQALDRPGGDRDEVFRRALASLLSRLESEAGPLVRELPLLISGMASASVGVRELPYGRLPLSTKRPELPILHWEQNRWLISGVAEAADVMRGEEVQLLGLVQLLGGDTATVLLPGTHSKHLQLQGGELVAFQTFMTGELFELLARKSLLRHSLPTSWPEWGEGEPPPASFLQGLELAGKGMALQEWFRVRARSLLQGMALEEAFWLLSGLLLGEELREGKPQAGAEIWLGATEPMASMYACALGQLWPKKHLATLPANALERACAMGQWQVYQQQVTHRRKSVGRKGTTGS